MGTMRSDPPRDGAAAGPQIDPSSCRPGAELSRGGGCLARCARSDEGRPVILVSVDPKSGTEFDVRAQADLLESLAAEGARALPRVLGRAAGAYVREDGEAWHPGGGRRRAARAEPQTAERLAQSAARDALEAALDSLHAADHVLGLLGPRGIGFRDDGSVLIRDLSGLRRGATLAGRLSDQRWLDSVLGDAGRTLRRRADLEEQREPSRSRDAQGGAGAPPRPQVAGAVPGDALAIEPDDSDTRVVGMAHARGPERSPSPRAIRARSWKTGRSGSEHLPGSSTSDASALAESSSAGRPIAPWRSRAPITWRGLVGAALLVSLLTAGAVLLAVRSAGSPATADGGRATAPAASASAASAPDPGTASTDSRAPSQPAGPLPEPSPSSGATLPDDPAALVASIATARREHLLTGAADTATAPGSSAAEQDARLADSYRGVTVDGWSTTVLSAEVIASDVPAGTASIRARIRESERVITAPDGRTTTVSATPEHDVVLDLVWVEGRWLLASVRSA